VHAHTLVTQASQEEAFSHQQAMQSTQTKVHLTQWLLATAMLQAMHVSCKSLLAEAASSSCSHRRCELRTNLPQRTLDMEESDVLACQNRFLATSKMLREV
jgi:hypothetical protein